MKYTAHYLWWIARITLVGTRTYVLYLSRSSVTVALTVFTPLVYSVVAIYLYRVGREPSELTQASVAAGMMGIWSSVLFGCGSALRQERWLGTLEYLVAAPVPLFVVMLPMTLAPAITGLYSMLATVLGAALAFHIQLSFIVSPVFLLTVLICILSMAMVGILMAASLILIRDSTGLVNALDHPIWLLSGMMVPLSFLPGWLHPLSWLLPTMWSARAVHGAVGGGPVAGPALSAIGTGLVYVALSLGVLKWIELRARKYATLSYS